MQITKADGNTEEFKSKKLHTSLKRAGASVTEADSIVRSIEQSLTPLMTTQEIYRQAFTLLRQSKEPVAAKYSMRRALFGLGPTGFPFEDFLARIFTTEGYNTKTRLTVKGKCAVHEIDVAAYSKEHSFIAEAKFHMRPGVKSDLQTALYSYARYLDLKSHAVCEGDDCGINDILIVTNTKFTTAAIGYAECVGMKLLSWEYPKQNSLQKRIDTSKLYPITTLSTLSEKDKVTLLMNNILLCSELVENPEILATYRIPPKKAYAVIEEARQLCAS